MIIICKHLAIDRSLPCIYNLTDPVCAGDSGQSAFCLDCAERVALGGEMTDDDLVLSCEDCTPSLTILDTCDVRTKG